LFGIKAMTAPAPAQLALRLGCPLIPVRIERTGAGRFRITTQAPLEPPDSGDRRADVARLMLELNRILEDWVRAKPEEWFWLHRRWPDAAYRRSGAGNVDNGD
jgi:KDO2-lipid IV(A) lauroyltransferase